jgi:hypothetical protein
MALRRSTFAGALGAAVLCPFVVVACSNSSATRGCTPGATQPCVGPGACIGGQSCRSDGQGFEACNCGNQADVGAPDGSPQGGSNPDAGPWDCLGNPPEAFQSGATTMVNLIAIDSLQPIATAEKVDGGSALDVVTYIPLPGTQIRACSSLFYPHCDNNTGTNWQAVDGAGVVTFTLPQSFAGFFEMRGASVFSTTFFPGQFVAGDTMATLPVTVLTLTAVAGLETVLPGVTLSQAADGGLGHVILSVLDCRDHFAPGVYFVPGVVSPPGGPYPTQIFYTVGQGGMEFPSSVATQTDPSGAGGILNVPAGAFTVQVYLASTHQPIAVLSVFVNPGVASLGYVRVRTH